MFRATEKFTVKHLPTTATEEEWNDAYDAAPFEAEDDWTSVEVEKRLTRAVGFHCGHGLLCRRLRWSRWWKDFDGRGIQMRKLLKVRRLVVGYPSVLVSILIRGCVQAQIL
jgi:hypothetical protein